MRKLPVRIPSAAIPNRKGTSPVLVTRNALIDPERASGRSQ